MKNLLALVILLSGCEMVDVARCDKGDFACVQKAVDPEDMRAAIMYAGPCYRFAYGICDKLRACEMPRPQNCVETMVETMCLEPFDPDEMNDCAYLMTYAECDFMTTPSEGVCFSTWN